jgi:hypothetical protein
MTQKDGSRGNNPRAPMLPPARSTAGHMAGADTPINVKARRVIPRAAVSTGVNLG